MRSADQPPHEGRALQRISRAVSGVACGAGAALRVTFHVRYIHLPGAVAGRGSGGTGLAWKQT